IIGDVFEFAIPCHPKNPQIRLVLSLTFPGRQAGKPDLLTCRGNSNHPWVPDSKGSRKKSRIAARKLLPGRRDLPSSLLKHFGFSGRPCWGRVRHHQGLEAMAKILIADDHPRNREYLVDLLRHCGHELSEAEDGAAALSRVRADHPDLVIADL